MQITDHVRQQDHGDGRGDLALERVRRCVVMQHMKAIRDRIDQVVLGVGTDRPIGVPQRHTVGEREIIKVEHMVSRLAILLGLVGPEKIPQLLSNLRG